MTMHLVRGMYSTRHRKPKFKMTKAKEASWRTDWGIYNRDQRRRGEDPVTWERYMDLRLGKTKLPKPVFEPLAQSPGSHPRYQDRAHHPSLDSNVGHTTLKETPKYTGTEIIGIAVLHKSCLQPVSSPEAAKEVARMRRN